MNEVAKFPVATIVEISIIGVYPASAYPTLQTLVEKFQEQLALAFVEAGGRDPHNRWAEARPATKEEVLHFTPRKLHFTEDGDTHTCDTAYVAKRNLTLNGESVKPILLFHLIPHDAEFSATELACDLLAIAQALYLRG